MNDLDVLANDIVSFEEKMNFDSECVVVIHTPIVDTELVVVRNKIITGLMREFLTATGYVNEPALMVFCHRYGFSYGNIDLSNHKGFNVKCGMVCFSVSA